MSLQVRIPAVAFTDLTQESVEGVRAVSSVWGYDAAAKELVLYDGEVSDAKRIWVEYNTGDNLIEFDWELPIPVPSGTLILKEKDGSDIDFVQVAYIPREAGVTFARA